MNDRISCKDAMKIAMGCSETREVHFLTPLLIASVPASSSDHGPERSRSPRRLARGDRGKRGKRGKSKRQKAAANGMQETKRARGKVGMPRRQMGGRSSSISTSVLVVLVIVVLFIFAEAALGTSLSSSVVGLRQTEEVEVGRPRMLRRRRANDYLVRMSSGKCLLLPGKFNLKHRCNRMAAE